MVSVVQWGRQREGGRSQESELEAEGRRKEGLAPEEGRKEGKRLVLPPSPFRAGNLDFFRFRIYGGNWAHLQDRRKPNTSTSLISPTHQNNTSFIHAKMRKLCW